MAIWKRIQRLSIKQFFILLRVFISRPHYIIPTHKATVKTMQICDKKFGKAHHKHTRENAFRHALWNVIIAKNCYKPNRKVKTVVYWAEKVTTLHEKLAPNEPLETAMDLHNNEIGRKVFIQERFHEKSLEEMKVILIRLMDGAVKVNSISEMEQNRDKMVYLE